MAKNVIFAIIWLILLVFIAWPIAGFCAGIWILLQVSLLMYERFVIVRLFLQTTRLILFTAVFLRLSPLKHAFPSSRVSKISWRSLSLGLGISAMPYLTVNPVSLLLSKPWRRLLFCRLSVVGVLSPKPRICVDDGECDDLDECL